MTRQRILAKIEESSRELRYALASGPAQMADVLQRRGEALQSLSAELWTDGQPEDGERLQKALDEGEAVHAELRRRREAVTAELLGLNQTGAFHRCLDDSGRRQAHFDIRA